MRQYKTLLQVFLRNSIYAFRKEMGYSQERMAELLHISPRSYIDQEHGKYSFSALSVIFFLITIPEERVLSLLRAFRKLLQEEGERGDVA
ncbi:hypothetical protein KQI82_09335 [Oscillibacter sp. MSJ-2]|uniref:HTH cro/C1-type domain-containing protein n=1 Tax=Dysosmobacter acutus TaxID=2841504 RepID=A0ABS6F9I0_9FIRM|nr:helix-turn-helix domain-containing protein [Dysosmobacter acutus]MBU5626933.1 hypothetical protein [Dysosmobacter acutus]MBU5627107.1 hypothetical protein [Dysosmobacter acutus]